MNTSIQILSFLAKKFNDNVTIFCCNSTEKKTSKLEKGYNFFFQSIYRETMWLVL